MAGKAKSEHDVLIKVTQAEGGARKEERIGNVLLVTSAEQLFHENSKGVMSVTSLGRPSEVKTLVQIVVSDTRLDSKVDERIIKQRRIGETIIETIDVGIVAPA